jgi:hypothetical protein
MKVEALNPKFQLSNKHQRSSFKLKARVGANFTNAFSGTAGRSKTTQSALIASLEFGFRNLELKPWLEY